MSFIQFDPNRVLGPEAKRSHQYRFDTKFYHKYMSGYGLDIGFKGQTKGAMPVIERATGIDLGYPDYDGKHLPFKDDSQDFVFSSHMLEHCVDDLFMIEEWHRVTKIGGHIIIIVPHQFLYEKKFRTPSKWNHDHQRFYTGARLLQSVEAALKPNSYRVRHLVDNDRDFNYDIGPDKHSDGCYEIELVLQKISIPNWNIE